MRVLAVAVGEPHALNAPPGAYRFESNDTSEMYGISCCCPCGCGTPHYLPFRETVYSTGGPEWNWDGNTAAPTLLPSILMKTPCGWHGYLRAGVWESC